MAESAPMKVSKSFLEDDLCCPVCCEVFQEPVLLACSHSVCKTCLEKFWETKSEPECPMCRSRCSKKYLINLALRNLCETFLEEKNQDSALGSGSEVLCSLHGEKFKLFCLDDKQPVCVVCRDSSKHTHHIVIPIDEAAQQLKDAVRLKLEPIRKKLKTWEDVKLTLDQTAQHIKVQLENTETQIKEEFEKLHQFLRDEEGARIAALREEEEQKSQMMKEKIEKMGTEILSISYKITTIEEELKTNDILFLQNYKSTVERAQCTLQDPERVSGALINVAKHLGNLKFRVWEKMQEIVQYTPVTLDPNTAHPNLILSEDLTCARVSQERQQLPDTPDRVNVDPSVLGSEGYSSGTHCWDVQVPQNGDWLLGLLTASAQRTGDVHARPGVWYMGHMGDTYSAGSTPQPSTLLTVTHDPQRVRVQLDWDRGKVTFSDPDSNVNLHTLRHVFTERVFPYFNTGLVPLKILPVKTSLITEQQHKLKERRTHKHKLKERHFSLTHETR
ncbi:zinc-binding protein A33-like [Alosa sapidissima]|uniref:zinc-binding protein A33-like n=1 Tax=Alosa sapidissima TaxID=34773 RepID=UPI001C09BCEF|nr:zinc-binding protein A33-like [Alosa sapidissima]